MEPRSNRLKNSNVRDHLSRRRKFDPPLTSTARLGRSQYPLPRSDGAPGKRRIYSWRRPFRPFCPYYSMRHLDLIPIENEGLRSLSNEISATDPWSIASWSNPKWNPQQSGASQKMRAEACDRRGNQETRTAMIRPCVQDELRSVITYTSLEAATQNKENNICAKEDLDQAG